jgi:hypothetical protein
MKTKMNKIIVFVIISFLCGNKLAQNEAKNVIRIGAGVNICDQLNGDKYMIGPVLGTEYQRILSKYIGITVNLSISVNHYGKNYDFTKVFGSVGSLITPFPDKFRWIKMGIGLSLQHGEDYWGIERNLQVSDIYYDFDQYFRYSGYRFGIHFPIRVYFIDNSKYELFVSYKIKTVFRSGLKMDNIPLCLGFGVKF